MNRRELIGVAILASGCWASRSLATTKRDEKPTPLPYKKGSRIPVAFVLSPGAELVDIAGPWGVFEYVYLADTDGNPFELFTVAETPGPLKVSGGMVLVPNFTFESVPEPKIIVVPAIEGEPSEAMLNWLRLASRGADLTMSICNGSFVLAKAGLLSGKSATCHHGAYALFQAEFPDVAVRRGARFVDEGSVATSGGLSSGVDLALHVVDRYFGREVLEATVAALEYQGEGWKDPQSNSEYAKRPVSTEARPICPVCEMEVNKSRALKEVYRGKNYYFCSAMDKERFDRAPDRFVN